MDVANANPALKVMLIDDDPKRADWVTQCLEKIGFSTCAVVFDTLGVLKEIETENPDVIIIDMGSPGRDILESLSIVSEHQPRPVVMFSEEQDPDYIGRAVEAGVSTYLVGGIDPVKVRPIIEVAMAQFRTFQQLREQLTQTQAELSQQNTVDQAKRLLISQHNLSEPQAYNLLRKQSMNAGITLAKQAERVIQLCKQKGIS